MEERSAGLVALSGFFVFGTVMAGLTCAALLFPGSGLLLTAGVRRQFRMGVSG
jgi:hypothetical protein